MKIESNIEFKELCKAWSVPADLQFDLDLPAEIKQILSDEIIVNKYGIRLRKTSAAHPANGNEVLTKSEAEDSNNHFHVDNYVKPWSNEGVFRLGLKTLLELADKFTTKGQKGICFTYSFMSTDMRKMWNKKHGFEEEAEEEIYISERLSFHQIRAGEELFEFDPKQRKYEALLRIEI
jgi:hypothetical protein